MISLIVARARNGAIGRDGDIPWSLPEDLKFFQRETLGGAIVMGRHTWESLPVKPLARRCNIVVSSDTSIAELVVPTVAAAIECAAEQGYQRVYGIGGARIYGEMLPLADRLLISEVGLDILDADTFFPEFDAAQWALLNRLTLRADRPSCVVHEYLRRA